MGTDSMGKRNMCLPLSVVKGGFRGILKTSSPFGAPPGMKTVEQGGSRPV